MVETLAPSHAHAPEPGERPFKQWPFSASYTPDYTVDQVRQALQSHDGGNFYASARLADIMLRDPVICGVLDSRTRCALGARFELKPAKRPGGDELAAYVSSQAEELLPALLRGDVVDGLLRSATFMGFALAQVVWAEDGTPSLEPWYPQNVSAQWEGEAGLVWRATTLTGTLDVYPDDGRWCLLTPGGRERSWLGGAIRSLGIPWVASQYALRDWLRYSERHGMPIIKGKIPAAANQSADKARFQSGLENMGSCSVVLLPQGVDQSYSYDVEIAEATANTWQSFKGIIDDAASKIAKRLSGTDVEATSGGIGSGQADASETQRYAIARGDARMLAEAIQDFVLRPWAKLHYGDADLAPEITVHLESPSEAEGRARLMLAAGQSIKALQDAGVSLDVESFARSVGIPLADKQTKNTAPIYAYHMQYGIPTVNEVRETLGLDPTPEGDKPTALPAAASAGDTGMAMSDGTPVVTAEALPANPATALVEAGDAPLSKGAVTHSHGPIAPLHARRAAAVDAIDYSDKIVAATRTELARAIKPDVDMLLRELATAKTSAEAKAKVVAFYKQTNAGALASQLAKAGELASLAGVYSQRGLRG